MSVAEQFDPADPRDPLHTSSDAHTHWTTSNIGEAMPGVMTPLGWTLWQCGEGVFRGVIADMGVLTEDERRVPARADDWIMRAFYGRIAWQVDLFATVGNRMPGTSAEEAAASLLGRVPEGLPSAPTRRFYPTIARRMPRVVATAPNEARTVAAGTEAWYRRTVPLIETMDLAAAQQVMAEAGETFARILTAQGHVTFAVVQPLYDALERLVKHTGTGDAGVLSGSGGAELSGMLTDIWAASRGRLAMDELLLRTGFHGPREGEVSSRTWREDQTPLLRIIEEYRGRDEADAPAAREAAARRAWQEEAAKVLAAVPRWQRPAVGHLLRLAARQIPLRGVAKRGMLQSIDGCRAAARRAGAVLQEDGRLDEVDDVFYLTLAELTGAIPADARDLVAHRRNRRAAYQRLSIPGDWRGVPEPTEIVADAERDTGTVSGIGVSRGVAEGPAHVVMDADFAEVEPGEILVAPTTDPSWASIMYVSDALVVDIGGALSHAAVVARELGIPCVVNTRIGTRAIRTGDRIRVDGAAGTVEILERAPASP